MTDAKRGFWDWLARNTGRVQTRLKRESQSDAQAVEIATRFEKAFPGLTWEISPADRGPWMFCISANGDRALFPRIERAVREAPKIEGWTIQAFRPRGALEATITMDGQTLGCDDIWCEVERIKGGISLVLHIRGVTPETEESMSNAALVLLDNAVGEYDAATKIGRLDLALLEGRPRGREDFFPLRDLPAFLDGLQNPGAAR